MRPTKRATKAAQSRGVDTLLMNPRPLLTGNRKRATSAVAMTKQAIRTVRAASR